MLTKMFGEEKVYNAVAAPWAFGRLKYSHVRLLSSYIIVNRAGVPVGTIILNRREDGY